MRPKRIRKISAPPSIQGFAPIEQRALQEPCIWLSWDEFEALRLADYLDLAQEEAALRMDVSRPTFGRILKLARNKVARALVESRCMGVAGGVVSLDMAWLRCFSCGHLEKHDESVGEGSECPTCGESNLRLLDGDLTSEEVL